MNRVVADIALIALLILIGGVFAAAEMALVSLREVQVRKLSTRGKRGHAVARLASDPNRFLSAVQIGVTLAGLLSAAFGGATLAEGLAVTMIGWGLPEPVAGPLALVLVTLVISYFTIVIGELSAKRLAMQRAESVSLALAPTISAIATLATPIIWFLGKSTDLVVRMLGGDPSAARSEVTQEELRAMVGTSSALGEAERQIVGEVFAAGDVSLREVMIPRTEVDFLAGSMPAYKAIREVQGAPHSRYPVVGEDLDDVLGFVHIRDLANLDPAERNASVSQLVRPVMSLPQTVRILLALTEMRKEKQHLVVVRDEYGGTAGIVTMEDLVEELVGEITDEFDPELVTAPVGLGSGVELEGLMTLEEFAERFGYQLPEGPYDTVAGFVMAQLGRLPRVGSICTARLQAQDVNQPDGVVELRVLELDGRRAARLRVTNLGRPVQDG